MDDPLRMSTAEEIRAIAAQMHAKADAIEQQRAEAVTRPARTHHVSGSRLRCRCKVWHRP